VQDQTPTTRKKAQRRIADFFMRSLLEKFV